MVEPQLICLKMLKKYLAVRTNNPRNYFTHLLVKIIVFLHGYIRGLPLIQELVEGHQVLMELIVFDLSEGKNLFEKGVLELLQKVAELIKQDAAYIHKSFNNMKLRFDNFILFLLRWRYPLRLSAPSSNLFWRPLPFLLLKNIKGYLRQRFLSADIKRPLVTQHGLFRCFLKRHNFIFLR